MNIRLLIGGILAFAVPTLEGAEYFTSSRGNDGNDGLSKESAFRTIQRGVSSLSPGDSLTICPGEYHESVSRKGLGSGEVDTTIRAEIPGTVHLRGDMPLEGFEKVKDTRFLYAVKFDPSLQVQAVNEVDTLWVLEGKPNRAELDFQPGLYHQDRPNGVLYISTSDYEGPGRHSYTASVIGTHGIYLHQAARVVIEGLAVSGFHSAQEAPKKEQTLSGTWGIVLLESSGCVIRECKVFLNGNGILVNSQSDSRKQGGGNLVEHCTAWANSSQFSGGDIGGITLLGARGDRVQHSSSFLNKDYGINIYLGKVAGDNEETKSLLSDSLAWGNYCDFKIKTGRTYLNEIERCVGLGLWSVRQTDKVSHSLIGPDTSRDYASDNIQLSADGGVNLADEFSDPENHDFRLQASSRFRGAGPNGKDAGPFPYQKNIYYVSEDGNDRDDGLSVKSAWKTLAKAAGVLKAGDTLYLLPGVYDGGLKLQVKGDTPVSVRGRGLKPAIVRGKVTINASEKVRFERVNFEGEVEVSKTSDIRFENCQFSDRGTGLKIDEAGGLAVIHCAFNGFRDAAVSVRGSISPAVFQGNIFDNRNGPALRLQDVADVAASNNAYAKGNVVWAIGERSVSLADSKALGETRSFEFGLDTKPEAFLGRGMLGRASGPGRTARAPQALRFVEEPKIHVTSATTANIEWVTSLPAACQIAWGETEACENRAEFESGGFASYSLTGLRPGGTYYFKLISAKVPSNYEGKLGVQSVVGAAAPVVFTTAAKDGPPRTFYVAPDGNDDASGLDRASAWKTISRAAAGVNVGDTVLIAGGSYMETVRLRATGAPDAPITFRAIPGEKVVLDGAGKRLNKAIVGTTKSHLRFDGLYFTEFSFFPFQGGGGWWPEQAADFFFHEGSDIVVTRCFSGTRAGYSATFMAARSISDLKIKNCVFVYKMGGSLFIRNCPRLEVDHSVFALPPISCFVLRNTRKELAVMRNNIFTDSLPVKAEQNIHLFTVDGRNNRFTQENNCYSFRKFQPDERLLIERKAAPELAAIILNPLFADPQFAGVEVLHAKGKPIGYTPDAMRDPLVEWDFNTFFATEPEVVAREIGLQRNEFADFHFSQAGSPGKGDATIKP